MSTSRWKIYLIHFDPPYKHARHYLGTSPHVNERMTEHANGQGSPLVRAAVAAGVQLRLARVWKRGGRALERRLKKGHNVPRLCPICCAAQRALSRSSDTPMPEAAP